jgi:putative ABC transport system permease protein
MKVLALLLRQTGRDLWSQRLRTSMTAFGIVWGTVAISLLLAFGDGLHRQMTKSFAGLGDRIVIGWPARTSIPFEGLGRGRRITMDEEDVEYLRRKIESLNGISSEYSQTLQARFGDRKRAVDVSGVSPVFGDMRNLVPRAGGRFVDPIDEAERRRVVFFGDQLALDLLGEADPVGKEVILHGSPFLVVGVLKPKSQDSSYSGRDQSKAFIPGSTFRALTGQRHIDNFIFRAPHPDQNVVLTRQLVAALGERLRFDPQDREAVSVWDTTEMFVFFDAFMLGFEVFLGIMGVLTLIVGGIGVSNIMHVVVEERTREIGIKMALGARGRTILGQFLAETMLLTGVGGAVGLGISWLICSVVPRFGMTEYVGDPTLSPGLAALTTVVLGLVGFLAGFFPAREAARLDPVVAMKL